MLAFIAITLIAVASADQLGYKYQPVGHFSSGLSFIPGVAGGIGGGEIGGGGIGGSGTGGPIGGGDIGGGGISGRGIGRGIGGGIGSGGIGAGIGGGLSNRLISGLNNGHSSGLSNGLSSGNAGEANLAGAISYNVPAQVEYNKEFFTFTAPEQDFEDNQQAQRISALTQKNLRVVFIKSPENKGLEKAVFNLAQQANDQKTAIYVLQKQTDIGDLANKLNVIRQNNNAKPEVHFVKYRTPEDAANAQRQIQSHYDSLGGLSQNHDGGVASVLNFASQGPTVSTPRPQAPGSSYLPASITHKRI